MLSKMKLYMCVGVVAACTGTPGETEVGMVGASYVSPDGARLAVKDVGLSPTSSTPPLGEGVAPIGGAGGDGVPVVTRVGGWSGGPGAVKWHGGQWVIPYSGRPGATIQNVSCDVEPNATSTDLIELVGQAGVISSVTVGSATGIVIRAWIVLAPGFTVPDGGNLVIRHSARDAVTGAWTSAAQDLSVISCSVNTGASSGTTSPFITSISGYASRASSLGQQGFADVAYTNEPFILYPVGARVGDVLSKVDVTFLDSASTTYEIRFFDSNDITALTIGATSIGNGTRQTLTLPITYTVGLTSDINISLQRKTGTGTIVVAQAHVYGVH